MNDFHNVLKELKNLIAIVTTRARTEKKLSVFTIATTANINNPLFLFPALRETQETIAGNLLVRTKKGLKKIIEIIDGKVDLLLVDTERKQKSLENLETEIRKLVKRSQVFSFKPNELTARAVDALLSQLFDNLSGKKVAIIGAGNLGSKITLHLLEREAKIIITGRNQKKLEDIVQGLNAMKARYVKSSANFTNDNLKATKKADILIGTTPGIPAITAEMVKVMNPRGIILDVGNGTLTEEAIRFARKKRIRVLCPSAKPGYDGEIETLLKTQNLIKRIGQKRMGSFSIISGGILGKKGDIIVDDYRRPTKILGVADGKGDVVYNLKPFKKNITKVERLIKRNVR